MADWTAPKTWATGELVSASNLNEQVRDNLLVLKDPPSDNYEVDEGSDYTTTSTSFVDVDATNLALTITTQGGDVMVHFHGGMVRAAASGVYISFDVDLDGARIGGDDGITGVTQYDDYHNVTFTRLITGLAAGEHTFKLQWKVHTSTGYLYAGAGTSNRDLHPQFWAREVS